MADDKLTEREKALLAAARREAEARKSGTHVPQPVPPAARIRAVPPAPRGAPAAANEPEQKELTPAERLAKLMAAERAETEKRKQKMRRYGIIVSGAILAIAVLSFLSALHR